MRVILSAATYGLAWFTIVNAALSLLSWLLSLRVEDRVIADARRSRRLLAIRFLPFAASGIVSLALFVPAHLWLEPAQTGETFGTLALATGVHRLAAAGACGVAKRTHAGGVDASHALDASQRQAEFVGAVARAAAAARHRARRRS